MKATDLIAVDNKDADVDEEIVSALGAFGFLTATGTLFQHPTKGWVYVISAIKKDGSGLTWIGVGPDASAAEADAVDAVAKWILTQPIPVTP